MRTIVLILIVFSSILIAYSTVIVVTEIAQIGGTDAVKVNKYSVRVVSVSLGVSGNVYNNQITSITISIASSHSGYYNIYATVSSGMCSASATWMNVYLSPTPRTLSSLLPQCDYTTAGASVVVRGVPA